jgi:hypothetical protein
MHKREDAANNARPYTKYSGAEIVARDFSNEPVDCRPYGLWRCRDEKGRREVIFNRAYQPLWSRRPGQPVKLADPKEWVEGIIDDADYFWADGRGTNERGLRLLQEWGIDRPEVREGTLEA